MNETPVGQFDSGKAARLRTQAVDAFQAQARKIARYMYAWLLVCILFAALCMQLFFRSTDVQSWILYAVVFLVMFESTVLVKLWYWVVNSKLGILREVKLLRLDLAAQKGSMDALEEMARVEEPFRPKCLSKWESRAWRAAIIAGALLIGVIIGTRGQGGCILRAPSIHDIRGTVTLNADGMGQGQGEWEMQNRGFAPLTEFPLCNGGAVTETKLIPASESPYTDGLGRKLAVRREPAGVNHRDVIQFVEPVAPLARFTLRFPGPGQVYATREGDVWTVKQTLGPSSIRTRYNYTIMLPAGADIVSAEPTPKDQVQQDGKWVLHLEAAAKGGAQWSYTVRYRLPEQSPQAGR